MSISISFAPEILIKSTPLIMVMIVSPSSRTTGEREEEWQGIRKYLDPNPHLKGVDKGRDAPKVSETRVFSISGSGSVHECPSPCSTKVSYSGAGIC